MTYDCPLCEKNYDMMEDLGHHLKLDHKPISSKILDDSTKSRETKKQLGDYVSELKEGFGFECPFCFEMISDIDRVETHLKNQHQEQITESFLEKLKSMNPNTTEHPPICEICVLSYLGLVTTKINGTVKNVCFTCYENHYGKNALMRLTIGTPDDMIKKMRKPLKQ